MTIKMTVRVQNELEVQAVQVEQKAQAVQAVQVEQKAQVVQAVQTARIATFAG